MPDLPVVVDFETEAIDRAPNYPPKPVGVSIWYPESEKPAYLAWGHPSENNSTYEQARAFLGNIWHKPLLFHHARFDTEVARVHMDLPYPSDPLAVHVSGDGKVELDCAFDSKPLLQRTALAP